MVKDAQIHTHQTDFEVAYIALSKQFEAQSKLIKELKLSLKLYEEKFRLLQQRKFSSKTENSHQLSFTFDGVDDEPIEETRDEVTEEKITYTRTRSKKKRGIDMSSLPCYSVEQDVSEEEKQCRCCGVEMQRWGEDVTKSIEIIPRQCFLVKSIRPKYRCKSCRTLKQSPAMITSPLPKSFAGSSLISDVIINKYHYHQPLYRQSQQLKNHGLIVSDNTLCHWVLASAEKLSPLGDALWTELLASGYLQIDETPVTLLSQKSKAYMWVYLSPKDNLVIYDYHPSREGKALNKHLSDYQGCIQSDGYSGYYSLRRSEGIKGFGCLAHARRKFFEIVKLNKTKMGVAYEVVSLMKKLYQIESKARERGLDPPDRHMLRKAESVPLLNELRTVLQNTCAPPGSALGKAVQYTLSQWPYLIKYVDHGEIEIDNNLVENAIRPFALGRRNWLFLGHDKSAERASLLYSLIESAKRHGLSSYDYMHYLLTQVEALRRKQINPVDLLPHRIDRDKIADFVKMHQERLKKAAILSE